MLLVGSTDNIESLQLSHTNTLNELNRELSATKEAYEQLNTEKQALMNELEKRSAEIDQQQTRQTISMSFFLANYIE